MIHFETHGRGPTIVLLHGVGLDLSLWDRCVPPLAASHRVVVPDLRGHGRSPKIEDDVSLAHLAADVAGVLDGPAHVVGFSLGALVASELAISCGESVAALTLVSSVADRSPREREAVRRRLALAEADFGRSAEAAVERWFDPTWRAREPELVRRVRAALLNNDRASYLAAYEVFAEADAGLWPRLSTIKAPTLVVTGELDTGSTPGMARRLAREIPDARAEIIPGARHLLPLQCPDDLVRLVLDHDACRKGTEKEGRWQRPRCNATGTT